MFLTYEEANDRAEYIDYEFPNFVFKWNKFLKSSAFWSLADLVVFITAIIQAPAALDA